MLEQLWNFVQGFATEFVPLARLEPWEGGVMMRWHKFHRVLGPGWHWRIPFVEHCVETIVVETTDSCPAQSITTKDNKTMHVQANVRYNVDDVKKFLIEVTDGKNAVLDQCTGATAHQIMQRTWDECREYDKLENAITIETRRLAKRYGVEVVWVTLTTVSLGKTVRLFGLNFPFNLP
jgi:regulator of protease activity HflC (stomatin/prohibitin superfamily)